MIAHRVSCAFHKLVDATPPLPQSARYTLRFEPMANDCSRFVLIGYSS
jgi:hypothetical protein